MTDPFATQVLNGIPQQGRFVDEAASMQNIAELVRKLDKAMDPFGVVRVSEYQPIFSSLPLPISVINDRVTTSGTATVEYVDGEYRLDRAAGETCIQSTGQRGRYQSGLVGVPGIAFRKGTEPTGTTTYYWGYFDTDNGTPWNGFGFKENSTTQSFVVIRGGVEVHETLRADWLDPLDGTGPSGKRIDTLDGLVTRLPFGYYGYMVIEGGFMVSDVPNSPDEYIPVARAHFPERISLPYANMPLTALVTGDGPGRCYVSGRQYGVFGQLNLRRRIMGERRTGQSISEASGFVPTISARVRTEMPWNTIPLQAEGLSLRTDSNLDWIIVIGATLTNGGSVLTDSDWNISQFSQGDTSTEFNTNADAMTGGEILAGPGFVRGGGGSNVGSDSQDIPSQDIPVGEPITLAVDVESNAVVRSSFRTAELR